MRKTLPKRAPSGLTLNAIIYHILQKLLDRTRARNEALHHKMQEHAFQARKRRPLENQENTLEESFVVPAGKTEKKFDDNKGIAVKLVSGYQSACFLL